MTAQELLRTDFALISSLVPERARVLDLGCGDGELLALLRERNGAHVRGIELDFANVAACVERDIPVIQADLDQGLAGFPRGSFDVVVLSQTLQVVKKPVLVLREMLRVGKRGVILFPNFGHWRVRGYLALRGRMPVSRSIPYTWYDTPNIHHTTIKDFRDFAAANGAVVERELPLAAKANGGIHEVRVLPNVLADSAVFVVRAADSRLVPLVHRDSAPPCCGHDVRLEKSTSVHRSSA